MPGRTLILVVIIFLILSTACNTPSTPTSTSVPPPTPTPTSVPELTPTPTSLPLIESEVSRVTVEEAKAALDNGTAVIVDVRSAEAFEVSHIAGAINIQLGEIETNPTGLNLDKDQWIITYCA